MDEKHRTVKILFPIGTLYPSQHGGPSNTIYWQTKALKRVGFEPRCISTTLGVPPGSVPFDQWIETAYGKVRYTSEMFHSLPFRLIFHSLRHLPSSDVVHLTSLFYPPSLMIGFIAVILGKKVVWSVRGNLEFAAMQISPIRKRILLSLVRPISGKITFHSTSEAETLNTQKYFGQNTKIVQIPNFMELPPVVTRDEGNPKYLLFIGRVHPIKGLDNLVMALSKSDEFLQSEVRMYIAGNDQNSYAEQLKKLVISLKLSHKVEFLGQVEGDEKQKLLANAYFLVLPSHTENFGNVVVEALAQGTPVVASQGTPWAILESSESGFWVDNSVHSLLQQIDSVLSMSNTTYDSYRANSNSVCAINFDIANGIQVWIDFYSRLITAK